MSRKSLPPKPARPAAEAEVRDIRRATRRHYSAEDKIRIALEGLRGLQSIAAAKRGRGIKFDPLCRRDAVLLPQKINQRPQRRPHLPPA